MKRNTTNSALVIGMLTALWLGLPGSASARTAYKNVFVNKYAIEAESPLNNCTVCHTNRIPLLNPYGKAFSAVRRKYRPISATDALQRIQRLDSDRDGFTNVREIRAGTFPGNPNSKPSP